MGSFFFFLTPQFSVLCLGPGAVRMSWPPGRGLGCWFSLLLRGPGWSSCPRAGAKGVQLRDRDHTTMPCRWRMPPVHWGFLTPGRDARVSAGPLSAVAWRGLALLALLGPDWGVGGLWVSGPRARSALVWSTAGGACVLAATAPWGVYAVAV